MSPHSPCDSQKDSTPSSGTSTMFLTAKITTKSPYFHRHRVLNPAQPSPISQPSTQWGRSVSERVSERTQRRRALCAANRMCAKGSCYIGVEPCSQTTLPVLFVEGWVASKSSLARKSHPETGWSVVNLGCKPLFYLKYILFVMICTFNLYPILGITDNTDLKYWSIYVKQM